VHGTIHCAARGRAGTLGAATTTSGLAFKIPGRVGDSPILGAGLWVDNAVGTAGSTGRGEANLFGLGSFVIVEEMRRGTNPKDACLEALRRIRAATVEPRLLNSRGTPRFQVSFYAMNARGEHAAVALYGGTSPKYAVCDTSGPRTVAMEALLPGTPLDDPPPPSPSR
jgi:N4-(beta-N-acetylglucosaminyl)-L-asparaginase